MQPGRKFNERQGGRVISGMIRGGMIRTWAVLLAAACGLAGQDAGGLEDAARWAAGLGDRFSRFSDPVVSAWALEELGTRVCPHNPAAGSGLLQRSVRRLNAIPDDAFSKPTGAVLPAASFTHLWRLIAANALECDPALAGSIDARQYEERVLEERREANSNVANARDHIDMYPERTAQILRGSLEVALDAQDPTLLEFPLVGKYLSELRERAPELADEVFPLALDLVGSAPAPSTALLNELGKYLFTSTQIRDRYPDQEYRSSSVTQSSAEITDFSAVRYSTDPGAEEAYIDAALRILAAAGANYNATQAYSIATQLVPKARELDLDSMEDLEKLASKIQTNAGGAPAAASQAGTLPAAPGVLRARLVRQVLAAIRGKRFTDARMLNAGVDDLNDRQQLRELTEFGEAAAAIGAGDIGQAVLLANRVRPGVKRSLLYAGLMAAAPPGIAEQQVDLLARDAAIVPAEFRTLALAAGTGALFGKNPERALTLLNDAVTAWNSSGSRRARFDPAARRSVYRQGAATATDVPVIRYGERRLLETVDSGGIRQNFELTVPGARAYTVPAALGEAKGVDYVRLEASALNIRDEWRLAQALLAIVDLRLGTSE